MDKELIEVLENRRLVAGKNGKPLGYNAWGKKLGVMYTTLFRFSRGQRTLGIEALRTLGTWGATNGDTELLDALDGYKNSRYGDSKLFVGAMDTSSEMDRGLIEVLESRRLVAGKKGKPLGYKAWGERLGLAHTLLFRFIKGQGTLGVKALETLTTWAKSNDDTAFLDILAQYKNHKYRVIVDN